MIVELTADQRGVLLQLIAEELREIGPEIRHSDTWDTRDELKLHRRILQGLQQLLTQSPSDTSTATDAFVGRSA